MGLDGGGGGGGGILGVGNSFTGPQEQLEIAGDFAYAYSGSLLATTTSQTALLFTSGNYLFVGELQLNAGVDPANPSAGVATLCGVKLNDATIATLLASAAVSTPETFASVTQQLIIPAYTQFEASVDSAGSFAYSVTVTLTGRIYR